MKKKIVRGLRNNNPGNIRINTDKFEGEIRPSSDVSFKQFQTMAYGYRAIMKTLQTYANKYKLTTLKQWIYRWAPPEDDNDTEAYVSFVSKFAKLNPDSPIDCKNKELMCLIAAAISQQETGKVADMSDVRMGWTLLVGR